MKAKFTYFRNTGCTPVSEAPGKYYFEGFGIVPDDFETKFYSKSDLIDLNNNRAPGMNFHGYPLIWLIEPTNCPPRLLIFPLSEE